MLDVCLAGTGGTIPLPNRFLTCCFAQMQGKALLIDCGEGTQIALKQAKCRLSRLTGILITHFHADHISGLPGLLLTLGNTGKTTPLTIIGPVGVTEIVSHLLVIAPFLPFPIEFIELSDTEHDACTLGDACITSLPLHHGTACLGYSISFHKKPVFNPQKAEALGVPKTYFQKLHSGNTIWIEGREITPNMVLDEDRPSLKLTYCTDTSAFQGLAEFAAKADLFICEGMHAEDAMREKMLEKGHLLFSDAAAIAKEADVKELWLTHFSPALQEPGAFLYKAQDLFPNTVVGCDGMLKSIK